MIATNTITVRAPERSIVLTSFGEDHIRSILPVPDSMLQYEPAVFVPFVKHPDPRKYMQGEKDVIGALTWGIFDPEIADSQQNPEAFLGTIALYDSVSGDTQEVATSIFRLGFEGKGIGTLAKLAIIHFAFSHGVKSITSETAVSNYPAQHSLQKSGFVQVGVSDKLCTLANGNAEPMMQWLLHGGDTTLVGSLQSEALARGHQTYLEAISGLDIQY